jgi:hypothetical protein
MSGKTKKPVEWYEKADPIEHGLLDRQDDEKFWKNPADTYDISTKEASAEVTERKWMRSFELHAHFMQSMKFRYAAEMEEDMDVSDPRRETSSAGATRPISVKTVITQSRSSTKSKGPSAQKKNAKRAILHQGLTVESAPSREKHREKKKSESAIEQAKEDALALWEKLQAEEPQNSVAIERVEKFLSTPFQPLGTLSVKPYEPDSEPEAEDDCDARAPKCKND